MAEMNWYQWTALVALGFCLVSCLFHFFRLVKLGKPVDYSSPVGSMAQGVRYAFTVAMDPRKKESARLHLPTYTAGLLYHSGTFLSILLFFFIVSGNIPPEWLSPFLSAFLCISAGSGIAILIKRIMNKGLRSLSNPDDYISNILVTLFQFLTLLVIFLPLLHSYSPAVLPSYYLTFTLLMLYLPLGKLRHVVYFFAARYHLGNFYGRRGVWPQQKIKAEE